MSARRRQLALSDDATLDFADVLISTQERWGVAQRREYRTRLFEAMRSLRDFPELGRPRDDLFLGCRSLAVDQHVVYYQITNDTVAVGRILHTSQDPTGKVVP